MPDFLGPLAMEPHLRQLGIGPLWSLDGVAPRVAADAFIAPNATVIGNVEIGAGASIWFNCVLRGDTNLIRVGARSNVQDGTVLHVNPGDGMACLIGEDVTIGHGAIVHAAEVRDGGFVGMAAVVLDGALIETGGVLAAGAVLTPGKRIGPNELWAGTPARLMRMLSEADKARFAMNAPAYVQNARRFRAGLAALGPV
jgi:carbonic anhydrase/acetyltransferase-like protein (isoleucine patch superfamily)